MIAFLLLCSIVQRTGKSIFFSIVPLEACEQSQRCFTWQSEKSYGIDRLYYFVRVDMTYRGYSGKIAKARKQGYKITPDLWPSSSHAHVRFRVTKYDLNLY